MRVSLEKQNNLALAFQKYTNTLTDEHGYKFLVLAASREDAEQVVCFVGLRDRQHAEQANKVQHPIARLHKMQSYRTIELIHALPNTEPGTRQTRSGVRSVGD